MRITAEPHPIFLQVRGRPEPFHHTDRNLLHRVAAPRPNPALSGAR